MPGSNAEYHPANCTISLLADTNLHHQSHTTKQGQSTHRSPFVLYVTVLYLFVFAVEVYKVLYWHCTALFPTPRVRPLLHPQNPTFLARLVSIQPTTLPPIPIPHPPSHIPAFPPQPFEPFLLLASPSLPRNSSILNLPGLLSFLLPFLPSSLPASKTLLYLSFLPLPTSHPPTTRLPSVYPLSLPTFHFITFVKEEVAWSLRKGETNSFHSFHLCRSLPRLSPEHPHPIPNLSFAPTSSSSKSGLRSSHAFRQPPTAQ